MRRALITAAALVAVQLGLIGLWHLVERSRSPTLLGVAGVAVERAIDRPAPPLTLRARDGSTRRLDAIGGPALVHVWASWCPPCRAELPRLIEAARGAPLVLISVDDDFAAVEPLLAGASTALAAPADVARLLDVDALPVTFALDADGRLRRRLDGARAWDRAAVDRALRIDGAR